jgi:hypothetical protein
MEENELGGECGTCGGEEKCLKGFRWRNVKDRDYLEERRIDGRVILKRILKK